MHWRRRRWWLVGVVGFVLLIRAALPEVIRRQLETRASELLQARVQVGDVDLGLLGGAVALEDVALRPAVAGGAPAPVEAQPAESAEPPVVAWRRLAVNLRWWMLARKVVRFSTVELDEPRVALDRLADGELNLLAFVPAGEAADAPPADEAEEGAPWGVGIDRLVLRAGNVRFRDFAVQEEGSEPVDVRLPTVDVRDVALAPGVYGGPARTSLDVRVDEGRLRVNTRVWLRDGGVALATTLRARRMPLERVRLYVPEVGWRELGGTLGASLVHRLEPRQRNRLTGTVTLDDVTVRVSDVETPALAWKHLGVAIDEIDLMAHRASIDTVELSGATVVVRPQGGTPVPAVARGAGGA
ncbi:MAG TPA: DUF748 domain-containing protein, partial [Candidatus Limnocylindria bacterium]|nr:DUF748 domain-containing protein [Candidatus Limnocylindria bacterium]